MAAKEQNSSMRDTMPTVAGWVDELRDAFGKPEIDAVIRDGLKLGCKPELRFYAKEAGQEVGQRYEPDPASVVTAPASGSAFVVPVKAKR